MLFNSITFLLFLPVVFALYWLARGRWRLQNHITLVASYVFYGWWDWRFMFLIAAVSLAAYYSGVLMDRLDDRARRRVLVGNLLVNIAVLGFFKYFNFFAENLGALLHAVGWQVDMVTLNVILPVGISFYTFQAMSYTIDVYKRKAEASHDVLTFMTFISFFPQLVAGPIERYNSLYPQFTRARVFSYDKAREGCQFMLWGFFKKIVIADGLADVVNDVWANPAHFDSWSLAIAAVLFAFQIYGDFSGYSDIAIGTAKLFGVELSKNFDRPFFARNVNDLWRRWHITLMNWLRDYIYIPLGGSRHGQWRYVLATFAVFFTSGLWHGANWTFIVWGLFYFVLLLPAILFPALRTDPYAHHSAPVNVFRTLRTFILFVLGVIVFRSTDMSQAMHFLGSLFTPSGYSGPLVIRGTMLLNVIEGAVAIGVLLVAEYMQRDSSNPLAIKPRPARWAMYTLITVWTFMFCRISQDFIYFQF